MLILGCKGEAPYNYILFDLALSFYADQYLFVI